MDHGYLESSKTPQFVEDTHEDTHEDTNGWEIPQSLDTHQRRHVTLSGPAANTILSW